MSDLVGNPKDKFTPNGAHIKFLLIIPFKVGDEIVRVNGFTISEAIHEEVLNLIKGKDEIELKVTSE